MRTLTLSKRISIINGSAPHSNPLIPLSLPLADSGPSRLNPRVPTCRSLRAHWPSGTGNFPGHGGAVRTADSSRYRPDIQLIAPPVRICPYRPCHSCSGPSLLPRSAVPAGAGHGGIFRLTWQKIDDAALRTTLQQLIAYRRSLTGAARSLGIHRNTLRTRISRLETCLQRPLTNEFLSQLELTWSWHHLHALSSESLSDW